ncbi:MAG: aldehyde dehydrogenase (NADP(+)) [Acidobacteriota bacterium]|nr:MAG: aldehyde dehydrogenase (NADP(+)) [Acidobacteriota bacterium]
MELTGKNLIAGTLGGDGKSTFSAFNPVGGQKLKPIFVEATTDEADAALVKAVEASESLSRISDQVRADFLREVADRIMGIGAPLIERAMEETGLPEARLVGERGRTVGQIRLFADLVEEGSWVEARIDTADPERQPLPKPDLRRYLVPLGPVVVFGASNFPLAFSVAGGDTVSALAAGNPVVVKAHPAHPGTSELVARAIALAVEDCSMPAGTFSLLHGIGHEIGSYLVQHPSTCAVGFTGSLAGGRALFDLASQRPVPIPVYAEMGSTNPVFLLPNAVKTRGVEIAAGLHGSVTLGVGQFCTNPGLVVGMDSPSLDSFVDELAAITAKSEPGTMLHAGIRDAYEMRVEEVGRIKGVKMLAHSKRRTRKKDTQASAVVFEVSGEDFLASPRLAEEVFGPSTLLVRCDSVDELYAVAQRLEGHLTATLQATEADLTEYSRLLHILEGKVGRLLFNGFPTGVEVCPSMHHGGPYPATTDSRSTSVGTAAISRFARPICYQNFPQEALPAELQDQNSRRIWRLVNGRQTREDL